MNLFSFLSFLSPRKSELDTLREQVEQAELTGRLKAAHKQTHVLESGAQPPWTNPYWENEYRWHYPTNAPVYTEDDGKQNTFSLEHLGQIRSFARDLGRSNSFAIGALEALENFLVGDGMGYTASTIDEASTELVAAVQDVWDEFADRTLWPEWEQEIVRRRSRDGEVFLRLFADCPSVGFTDVRIIEPDWVVNPAEDQAAEYDGKLLHWCDGIGCDPEDRQTPLAYWVEYPGQESGCLIPACEVIHIKANADRNVPRGLSDFFATGEALASVESLLRNMAVGESVRAAIAGFWEYENATSAAVQAHLEAQKDRLQPRGNTPNQITGKTDNYQKIEPGSFIHVPGSKKFMPPPTSPAASSQVQVEDACLRSIATRWQFPEFIFANAGNNNYASILVAGSPFARQIRKVQGILKQRFGLVVWKVLEVAAKAGRIVVGRLAVAWEDVQRLCEMQIEAPTPELSNEKDQADVDLIDMDRGVMSKQTRQMRRGLDPEQEAANMAKSPILSPLVSAAEVRVGGPDQPAPADNPSAGPTLTVAPVAVPAGPAPSKPAAPSSAVAPQGDQSAATSTNDLRATVGGSAQVSTLQTLYYSRKLPREAAMANAIVIFGFTEQEAESLFPVMPPDAPTVGTPTTAVKESLEALAEAFFTAKKKAG